MSTPSSTDKNFPDGQGGSTGSSGSQPKLVKAKWNDNATTLVEFVDGIVLPSEVESYSQRMHFFVQAIAGNYGRIVLSLGDRRIEFYKHSLSNIFLKAVADRNGTRQKDKLAPVKVFLLVPVLSLRDPHGFAEIHALAVGLENFIQSYGTIAGIIFSTSLVQTLIPAEGGNDENEMNMTIITNVEKCKRFLKSIQLRLHHKVKVGLALSSYEDCIKSLETKVVEVISSFDMILVNPSFTINVGASQPRKKEHAELFSKFVRCFQKKYKRLDFYKVEGRIIF